MPPTYRCTRCKQIRSKETLFSKSVVFRKLSSPEVVKSRVTEWLCSDCIETDEQWNTPANSSPGIRSEAKARAEAVKQELKNKIFGGSIE